MSGKQEISENNVEVLLINLTTKVDKIYEKLGLQSEWLDAEQICQELKIKRSTLYTKRMRDQLRGWGMTHDGAYKIRRSDLEAFKEYRAKNRG